jgi:hypothetical protein
LTSTISSVNQKGKQINKMKANKSNERKNSPNSSKKSSNVMKNSSMKQSGNTKTPRNKYLKYQNLKLDPYVLPLLKNKVLSPITRARRILGKTPKLDKMTKIDVDSSLEKSLKRIDFVVEDQFNSKAKADEPVYSK